MSAGQVAALEGVLQRAAAADELGHPHRRWQRRARPARPARGRRTRPGPSARAPRRPAACACVGAPASTTTPPSRPARVERRRGQSTGAAPPRPRRGSAGRGSAQASSSSVAGVAAVGHRLGPGRGDDQAGRPATAASTSPAPEVCDRHAREGPAELLGGAPGPDHAERSRCGRRSAGTRTAPATAPHQRHAGGAPAAGQRQRPVRSAAQRAGLAAGLAGQRGQVAAAWHLDRAPGPARAPALAARQAAEGRWAHGGRAVPVDVGALAGHEHPRGGAAHGRRGGRRPGAPRRPRPALHRDGAGEAAGQQGGALGARPAGPSTSRTCGYGARGSVEQVVTVVPPGHQAEVAHRGEGRGPGADDDRARGRAAP